MSEKLKIVYRPLQELSPYAHNARTHSIEQVAQLVESIKQFGWTNPVLIDEKGEIIAGHGRVMAAEMLKMDSVPVIVLSGLTDEQKKAYRLADNRLPMNAGWDEDLLRMELSDLINADFDVSLTGFGPTEIDELLTDVLPGMRDDFCAFILTHGRPDKVLTYRTLRRAGYRGECRSWFCKCGGFFCLCISQQSKSCKNQ